MFDYTSKEWIDLLTVIKNERVNEKGEIICEHCGYPINKAYDCIGHHSIVLDDTNCNDALIALNPDLIQLVHHRCHNIIHNKLGYAQHQVYLVYGSPLSGKSKWVRDNMNEGDIIIDVDRIWQCLSGCDMYVKPNRLTQNVLDVRNNLIDAVKMRRGKWNNAYIVGGYPLISERQRLSKSLRAREVFIDTPKEICIERLNQCSDGRNVDEWTKYIEEWWRLYSPLPRTK